MGDCRTAFTVHSEKILYSKSNSSTTNLAFKSISKSKSKSSNTCLRFNDSLTNPLLRNRVSQSGKPQATETHGGISMSGFHGIDQNLLDEMVYDSLVWSSLHGLVVGDKSSQVCSLYISPSLFSSLHGQEIFRLQEMFSFVKNWVHIKLYKTFNFRWSVSIDEFLFLTIVYKLRVSLLQCVHCVLALAE